MFRTRDQHNRDQRYSSVPEPTSGDAGGGWGDRLMLEPVKDDGRRTLNAAAPATPTGDADPSDRYIVGVNATGVWASLIGDLVQHDGTSWAAIAEQHTGAQVYSLKRDESLSVIETVGATIPPTLSPEVLTYATTSLKFWMPNSLVDSFYSNWKGRVASVTTASGSWATTMYQRYVVIATGDPTYSAFAKFIATYIADINTNTGKWVFQPAKEGDLLYSEGDNNFYYFDGTNWVELSTGNTAFYGAEGRQGGDGLGTKELTAAVINTYQKIPFDLSAITNLTYCPPSFFADGEDTFTIPRYGVYGVGYHGFQVVADGLMPENVFLAIKINGTVVQQSTLTHVDDYEGDAYHGIFELDLNDEVTFEFKTSGANWDSPITIQNGPNAYVYTVDAKGGTGEFIEHALNDHTDTNFPTPADGDTLVWDAGTSKWVNTPATAAGPHLVLSATHTDSAVTGSVTNGQYLKRVGGNWTNAAPPTFEELNDTTFTGLASGDIAQWNGTAWVNVSVATLSAAHTLDSHSNVNTSGKITGSNLRWNGSAWVVYTPTLAGLSDVSISSPTNGQGLIYSGGVWTNGTITAVSTARCGSFQLQVGTSIPSGGVPWTADYQTASFLPAYPNNGAFVADLLGKWKVTYTGYMSITAGGLLRIRLNGGTFVGAYITNPSGTVTRSFTLSYNQALSAGSYVELVPTGVTIIDAQATFEYLGA